MFRMLRHCGLKLALPVVCGVVLAYLFWQPLWHGGGFMGGDVYSYFLPQKSVYAERLKSNEFPLWNNRVGFGYPLVGESQTAPFYPANLLLYSTLDLNTAYNANHLLHYVLAFVFTYGAAKALGLKNAGSLLAAVVFIYGWFPPRTCWEWAIITGAWLPAAIWCAERFLQTRRLRFALLLCVCLSLQLLAGHFQIAFITILMLVVYLPARLVLVRDDSHGEIEETESASTSASKQSWRASVAMLAVLIASIALSFGLAAVQLLPTWELKRLSQREQPGEHHDTAQGLIPLEYFGQIVRPWYWYRADNVRDVWLNEELASTGHRTNQAEAHLYFGLAPFILATVGVGIGFLHNDRRVVIWTGIAVFFFVLTTGFATPITEHLPGFSFFQGAGRYGLAATFAVAILAGRTLDRVMSRSRVNWLSGILLIVALLVSLGSSWKLANNVATVTQAAGMENPLRLGPVPLNEDVVSTVAVAAVALAVVALVIALVARSRMMRLFAKWGLAILIVGATLLDLRIVGRVITYSPMVAEPPVANLPASTIRQILTEHDGPTRIHAPGANMPSMLGTSSLPVYFTFGPAEYTDPSLTVPDGRFADQLPYLRSAGVTHLIRFTPLEGYSDEVTLLWQGFDAFYNRALERYDQPLYLYELKQSRGRVFFAEPDHGTVEITEYRANRVEWLVDSPTGGKLVLTELDYPGWSAAVDGETVETTRFENRFRAVRVPAGEHRVTWMYSPRSLYWGSGVSAITAALLLILIIRPIRQRWTIWIGISNRSTDVKETP